MKILYTIPTAGRWDRVKIDPSAYDPKCDFFLVVPYDQVDQYAAAYPNVNVLSLGRKYGEETLPWKRQAILRYAIKEGYDYCIQCDDDLKIVNDYSRYSLVDNMVHYAQHGINFVGVDTSFFHNESRRYFRYCVCNGLFLIDIGFVKKHNIGFYGIVDEDVSMSLQVAEHRGLVGRITSWYFQAKFVKGDTTGCNRYRKMREMNVRSKQALAERYGSKYVRVDPNNDYGGTIYYMRYAKDIYGTAYPEPPLSLEELDEARIA